MTLFVTRIEAHLDFILQFILSKVNIEEAGLLFGAPTGRNVDPPLLDKLFLQRLQSGTAAFSRFTFMEVKSSNSKCRPPLCFRDHGTGN